MKKILIKIIITTIIIYIVSIFFIAQSGLAKENNKTYKYAVVYSNDINNFGGISAKLKSRLNLSIELINNSRIEKIILSGGNTVTGVNKAELMEKYLIYKGIDSTKIILDKKSKNFIETSENTYKIVIKENIPNVSIVSISDFYNTPRIKLSLKNTGLGNISTISHKDYEIKDIYSLIIELPKYIKYNYDSITNIVTITEKDKEKIKKALKKKVQNTINSKYNNLKKEVNRVINKEEVEYQEVLELFGTK